MSLSVAERDDDRPEQFAACRVGTVLMEVTEIDDSGQIVGYGTDNGKETEFELTLPLAPAGAPLALQAADPLSTEGASTVGGGNTITPTATRRA
ncbi:MAG: hypothetical protein JOY71_24770 [Acetobacteraceae bacterium]|nr:hypothetical protein [Acetobacteraceae bacterium]